MPNWCMSTLAFFGKREEVFELYNDLEKIEISPQRLETDFGKLWLGNIIDYYGKPWKEYHCRGVITSYDPPMSESNDYDPDIDEDAIFIETETAWAPLMDFADIICKRYPSLQYVYISEEPGMRLYRNTDTSRRFFPEEFGLSIHLVSEEKADELGLREFDFSEFYYSEKEFLADVGNIFGKDFASLKEFSKYATELRDNNPGCFSDFVWFYYSNIGEENPFEE